MRENLDEVVINATAEEVWEVLTDLEKHSEWNPLIYRATGAIVDGQVVRVSARSASYDMNFRARVIRVEPNREFEWHWHILLPFLFRGEHIFKIEPIDEQSVRFINQEIFKGLLIPFWARDIATNSKDAMVAMDKALKSRVEGTRRKI